MSFFSKSDISIAIIACFLGMPASLTLAEGLEVNVREGCRRAVAGAYLAAYDRHEKAKQQLTAVAEQKAELSNQLAKLEKNLADLRNDEGKQEFSIEIAAKKNQLLQTLNGYRTQLQAYTELHDKAEGHRQRYAAEQGAIAKEMGSVFKIVELATKEPEAGYPFRIDYKHACTKYRRLCPLPFVMARDLKQILILGKTPQECERYANFSNLN